MTDADATTMAIVAEIFAAFPGRFRFTSGRRTVAQNAAVGGVEGSYHVKGQAADFVAINGRYPPGEKEAIGEIVARHGYEVIFHDAGSGDHYHIEPAPGFTGANVPSGSSKILLYGLGFVVLFLLIDD